MLINYGVNEKNLEGDVGFIEQVTIRNKEKYKRISKYRWLCYYYDQDAKEYLDAYKAIATEVLVVIISCYKKKKTRITYKCCAWDKINSEEQKGGEE